MKNLLLKLTIIVVLVVACNAASAVYTDTEDLLFLAHCDETNLPVSWLQTPDDNSSGRESAQLILDINYAHDGHDSNTIPTLTSGSPYGGSYFHFDGFSNTIDILPYGLWPEDQVNAICDFSFRWQSLPPAGDYLALVQTIPWRSFIDAGGRVRFLMPDNKWIYSDPVPSNTWVEVHYQNIDGEVSLIVDGIETTLSDTPIGSNSSWMLIGRDMYGPHRFFHGDIDEIRVSPIPEPCLQIIICLLFVVHRIKKI